MLKKTLTERKANASEIQICLLQLKTPNTKCIYVPIFHSNLQLKTTDPAYQKILIVTELIKFNPQIFSTFIGKKIIRNYRQFELLFQ